MDRQTCVWMAKRMDIHIYSIEFFNLIEPLNTLDTLTIDYNTISFNKLQKKKPKQKWTTNKCLQQQLLLQLQLQRERERFACTLNNICI